MVHLIVGKVLIAGAANGSQKKEILPGMAAGKRTASIALSEPGAGSDPKRIRTTAVKKGRSYVLDGEKAWLTNGPLADLLIVFAVTGERGGRKDFTAFIVPKETHGLTVRQMPALGYLRPSPHCEIRLEGCDLPETAILGRSGRAWEDLLKPFRVAEDVLLSGIILGGLDLELRQAAGRLRGRKGEIENDLKERVGGIAALLEMARQVARVAAGDLDSGNQGMDVERGLVAFHLIAKTLQESHGGLLEEQASGRPTGPGAPGGDIAPIIGLGMHASQARQRKWGGTLLIGKEKSRGIKPGNSKRKIKDIILQVQKDLLIMGAEMSTLPEDMGKLGQRIWAADVDRVEDLIDRLQEEVPFPREFIYPGKNAVSAQIDVGRTVIRRAERRAADLKQKGLLNNAEIHKYLNRLADMLFTLARYAEEKG